MESFIPGGSINKGSDIIVLVLEMGKDIRSYTSVQKSNIFSINFLNKVGESLKYFYIPILFNYVFLIVFRSIYVYNDFSFNVSSKNYSKVGLYDWYCSIFI